jgi:hypothetical protein
MWIALVSTKETRRVIWGITLVHRVPLIFDLPQRLRSVHAPSRTTVRSPHMIQLPEFSSSASMAL